MTALEKCYCSTCGRPMHYHPWWREPHWIGLMMAVFFNSVGIAFTVIWNILHVH